MGVLVSVVSLLVIDPSKLPTFEAMCDEAARGGEPVELTYPADLKTHSGFLPFRVHGRDTGFEYYFDIVPQGALPADATSFGTHHLIARTGSSFEEGRAALLFLKVAARLTGGAYIYPDDAVIVPPEQVASYLSDQIGQYDSLIQ